MAPVKGGSAFSIPLLIQCLSTRSCKKSKANWVCLECLLDKYKAEILIRALKCCPKCCPSIECNLIFQ